MKHTFVYPSAKHSIGIVCAATWRAAGYELLVGLDTPCADFDHRTDLVPISQPFPGYYRVINSLVAEAFRRGADLVTAGGDDQLPPEQGAEYVSKIYFERYPNGEGVMQACGDPQGELIGGVHNAARICGSPTFGRGWLENGYACGPFFDGYRSFYSDEDLLNFAKRRELLWMNFDVTIDHKHWAFGRSPRQEYHVVAEKNWNDDKALFEQRKAAGFPA